MEKDSKRRNKIIWLLVGFILSWVFATLLFRPQPGVDSWTGTVGAVLIYGYSWLIPIVGVTIVFTNDKNSFRRFLRNNYWIFTLATITVITMIISWNISFSNDLFFVFCWVLTALWWLTIYFRMKFRNG
jgi:hypothetical protein